MDSEMLSRREFLKLSAFGLAGVSMRPFRSLNALPEFPSASRLGRITKGFVDLKARPDPGSATIGVLYEDAVFPWLRTIVGEQPNYNFNSQRWVETPDGYLYGQHIQPVYNRPNQAVDSLPTSSLGQGTWMEVTVPYAEASLVRAASTNSWVDARQQAGMPLRVYYSQVFWVDQILTDDTGQKYYRINPNYYGGVDMLLVEAEAFRPIPLQELSPISPDVSDKRIEVDLGRQTMSCYEDGVEVKYSQVSTGAKFDRDGNVVDAWATPIGQFRVTRKYVSLQMSGGTTGAGYDIPGIGWVTIFATGGVAFHSTFWHNQYGDPLSRGCVNCTPEDAKWVFRWTMPEVISDPGMLDVTVTGQDSTRVTVLTI